MLTTPKQTEQYGHSNSQSNKYGPAKNTTKQQEKWKNVNHTVKNWAIWTLKFSVKQIWTKKNITEQPNNEKYINHTEKINNMNLQILSQTNMDNSQTEYGHSQTESWTFWHWKTLQNSFKIDKSMSGTDMDNIFQ